VIVATGRHGTRGQAIAALRELVRGGLPAVIVCDRSPDTAIPAIRIDDDAGAYAATSHLLQLGHRQIAHLTAGRDDLAVAGSSVEADRFQGYLRALAEAGATYEPAWLLQGEPTLSGGYALMQELLARPGPRPTAVFCVSDLGAIGALRALYEAGMRVPEELALVGFDGILLGQFTTPALTTMNQPREAMGQFAAEMLFQLLEGHQPRASEQVLVAELLIRESCGAVARIKRV
jgi:DNA-binding LacI/PurR family transcriptional regulator